MQLLENTLTRIRLEEPRTHRGLTMVPLSAPFPRRRDYRTLNEALAEGSLDVGELNGGARVPHLEVTNKGDVAVLLVDGELLQGAMQDRVLNLTVLVPEKTQIVVPVSCVQRGRWGGKETFDRSTDVLDSRSRAEKMAFVSSSLGGGMGARSDQLAVWQMIEDSSGRLGVRSPSSALQDVYRQRAADLDDYRLHLQPVSRQVGGVFFHGERLLGIELVDHPETFAVLFEKYLRSYAVDALIEDNGRAPTDPLRTAEAMLREAAEARWEIFPSIGLGSDLRLSGKKLEGAGLAEWGRVVQMSVMGRE